MERTHDIDTIVIGAGQAGLATSRWLQQLGVQHVVLERGLIGYSWRAQRWRSFRLNTPNAINQLPGDTYQGDDPDGFDSAVDLIGYFEDYCDRHELPIVEGVRVTSVRRTDGGFEVDSDDRVRTCRAVVVCSGDQNHPRLPDLTEQMPDDIAQLHAGDYHEPAQLPDGAVLIVGSAQSGVQIAEDLVEAGRKVYLCTSKVGRAPRRYRGKDLAHWIVVAGLADQRPEDLPDRSEMHGRQGQVSGTHGGHTVSLHQLARDGVTLLGRLEGLRDRTVTIGDELAANVAVGDEAAAKMRAGLDMFISKAGIDAPPAEDDPVEAPFDGIDEMAAIREVDLDAAGIRSVVWATGFGPNMDFLDPELLDDTGRPRHTDGVCDVPGLYCVGFTWLRRRASGLILGVDGDAEQVAQHIAG